MSPVLLLVLALQVPEGGGPPPTAPVEVGETPPASPQRKLSSPAAPSSPPQGAAVTLANLDGALDGLLSKAAEVVRVAVMPIRDDDEERARALQAALVRALLERGREEVVTPSMVKEILGEAAARSIADGSPAPLRALAADHVILSEVLDAGGEVRLELRLVHVESGGVLAQTSTLLSGKAADTTARAPSTRAALLDLADQLLLAIEPLPGDIRYQRVAVAPILAEGEAVKNARLERFVQSELSRLFGARGFLVTERAELDAALEQMALGAALGEEQAPALGKLLDAQAIVLGSVADAGDRFLVTCRAVGTESGRVLGAASVHIPREGAVTLASGAIETRTPEEAFFRSLLAPGWGQMYNQAPAKGLAFAAAGYGGALTTVGLGIGTAVSWMLYDGYRPNADTKDPAREVVSLREQRDGLLIATGVSAAITGAVWGAGAAEALLDGMARE